MNGVVSLAIRRYKAHQQPSTSFSGSKASRPAIRQKRSLRGLKGRLTGPYWGAIPLSQRPVTG